MSKTMPQAPEQERRGVPSLDAALCDLFPSTDWRETAVESTEFQ